MVDETELIAAAKDDSDQFGELVQRFQAGLIIHCDQLLGNRHEAEDIAQEAFLRAYTQLDRFDPKLARFSTWLYKIATNLAIDHLRKYKQQVIAEDIEVSSTP